MKTVFIISKIGTIHAVDAKDEQFTNKGGLKIGKKYLYPPAWFDTSEMAKAYLGDKLRRELADLEKKVQTVKDQITDLDQTKIGLPDELKE